MKAMDLRFLSSRSWSATTSRTRSPAPQALIDRELLDGDLSERHSLGLYAGPRGTATVVLRVPNEHERRRGSLTGAVVTGLGRYDGALSAGRPDRGGAHRRAALPAAGDRRARQGRRARCRWRRCCWATTRRPT